jgi:hypothetical protein
MKKQQPARKPSRRPSPAKKSTRSAPPRSSRSSGNQELAAALSELLEISRDTRDLLVQIRDLLAEAEEEYTAEERPEVGVEAVVIEEGEEEGEDDME